METFDRRTLLVGGTLGAASMVLPGDRARGPAAGWDFPEHRCAAQLAADLCRTPRPDPAAALDRLLADHGPPVRPLPGTPTG